MGLTVLSNFAFSLYPPLKWVYPILSMLKAGSKAFIYRSLKKLLQKCPDEINKIYVLYDKYGQIINTKNFGKINKNWTATLNY